MNRRLASVLFHAVVSVVLTFPLIGSIGTSLARGTETTPTVGFFNLWTLRWNAHELGDLFRSYWHAPIFHPTPGAFALSEVQPLTGIAFAPLAWISGNPTLAYNLVLLGALTLNGLAAARLTRRLGAAAGPALLAGVLAQALPFVFNELGVLQLAMLFPIFYLVDALLAWSESAPWGQALAVGWWLAATFLTCGYYGLFVVVVLGAATLTLVRRTWFTGRRLGQAAAALGVAVVLAGPMLVGQAIYAGDFERSDRTILANSARGSEYLSLDPSTPGATVTPWLLDAEKERLYPGTALLVLGAIGLWLVGRPSGTGSELVETELVEGEPVAARQAPADNLRLLAFFLVGIGGALVLSLGLQLHLGSWRPYDLLRMVPGYHDLRSPFRAAVLVQILLVPLAGLTLDRLWRWRSHGTLAGRTQAGTLAGRTQAGTLAGRTQAGTLAGRTQAGTLAGRTQAGRRRLRLGPVLAVAIVVLGVVEVVAVPQALDEVPDTSRDVDWVDWLATHHEAPTGDGSVAMAPFPATNAYESYRDTTAAMLAALEHGHPLVNGYSGNFPPSYDELEGAMRADFPGPDSLAALEARRVSWVVTDHVALTPEQRRALVAWGDRLVPVFAGATHTVYELHPAPTGP